MDANPKRSDPRWERTRRALISGGREVMAQRGVEAATILDIVRAAGVSQPSFYNHFSSKEELAEAIATEFFQADADYKQRVFAAVDDVAIAMAINCLHTLRVATRNPVVAWVLIHAGSASLLESGSRDKLVVTIRQGIKSGRFCEVEPRTAALMIRGAAIPVLREILQGKSATAIEQQFTLMVLQLLGLPRAEASAVYSAAILHIARFDTEASPDSDKKLQPAANPPERKQDAL